MDRLGAVAMGQFQDSIAAQIAFRGRFAAQRQSDISLADMGRFVIRLGINGDRFDAQTAQAADHSPRDLPAIGDKDATKHR